MTAVQGTRRLRVVQSFRFGREQSNPYLAQLVRSLPESIECVEFSWRRVLVERYDVLHVHWPEWMIRRRSRWKTAGRIILMVLMLTRIALSRKTVVRTVHNDAAHEPGHPLEAVVLEWLDRLTGAAILLNPASPGFRDVPSTVILHGDYREWFASYPLAEPEAGRLVNFGLIRPYKGVERLIEAFAQIGDREVSLRIVGRPSTTELGETIRRMSERDARVHIHLAYVDDRQLALEVSSAELIVLPYAAMHNSGAVILALSLGRPVLVPESPTTKLLRDEVGEDWVWIFSGEVGPTEITSALRWATTARRRGRPDLSRRAWSDTGEQTARIYREAVRSNRTKRRPPAEGIGGE